MSARQFHNALRILLNIDVDSLLAAGVVDENWGTPEASSRKQLAAFIEDPLRECLHMPDANFDRLYALIQSRQPQRAPTHFNLPIFDAEDRSGEAA